MMMSTITETHFRLLHFQASHQMQDGGVVAHLHLLEGQFV